MSAQDLMDVFDHAAGWIVLILLIGVCMFKSFD